MARTKKKSPPIKISGLHLLETENATLLEIRLDELRDPYLRLGAQGLHRLILYGQNHVNVVRHDDKVIKLTGSRAQFEALARDALGNFDYGCIRLPGYAGPNSVDGQEGDFVPVLNAQRGLSLFGSARGMRRTKSLTADRIKDGTPKEQAAANALVEEAWFARRGQAPWYNFTLAGVPALKTSYRGTFTAAHDPTVKSDVSAYELGDWYEVIKLGSVYHPAFNMWNNVPIKRTHLEGFVIWFAALAYIWVQSVFTEEMDYLGVGVDLPTFGAADRIHDQHAHPARRKRLNPKSVPDALAFGTGSKDYLVQQVLDLYGFPTGTYSVLSDVTGWFIHDALKSRGVGPSVSEILAAGRLPWQKNSLLLEAQDVRISFKSEHTVGSAILYNVKWGFPWATGLSPLFARKNTDLNTYALQKEEKAQLTRILDGVFSHPEFIMEQLLANMARYAFLRVVQSYEGFGQDKWNRAETSVLRTHLARITDEASLYTALDGLNREAPGAVLFSPRMLDAMRELVQKNPAHLRALLQLGASSYRPTVSARNAFRKEVGLSVTEEAVLELPEVDVEDADIAANN